MSVLVTGVGLAVAGLSDHDELLGERRGGGFDPRTALLGRDLRHKDRATRLALRAAEPALRDAGLLAEAEFAGDADRTAVVVSSNLGNLDSVCLFTDLIARETVEALTPLGLPQTSSNVITGAIAIRWRLRGPNVTLCNGETSGLDAVHWAATLIAAGRADTAVVVGVEPAGEVVDKLVGADVVDGAVALVLESAERAAGRGAVPHARIGDYRYGVDQAAVRAGAAGSAADMSIMDGTELQARLGRCSGALGVFQCAAALSLLRDGAAPVLASITGADETAALLLLPA
ncbi:beta-ketoacyl synthase N-terminal-like domain-containing protein [Actinokineospora guangxiensis]|uniref:Beta-ketoacyl synthase N-terminal-like domain-containing protein n=1 Tax=Actinokineospora guangxiensis TaxID=1490288 RepID=A0ABW0EH40_9PSEU